MAGPQIPRSDRVRRTKSSLLCKYRYGQLEHEPPSQTLPVMAGGPQRSATRQVYYILFVIAPGLCLAGSVSASFPFWTQSALRAW